jgi:hypothetical protein
MSSEFKIGDKVRVSENYPKYLDTYSFADSAGELVRTTIGNDSYWMVSFDHGGWPDDLTDHKHCWSIESKWLTKVGWLPKVEEKPNKPPQTYKGNGKHVWEPVVDLTKRLRVPGGWLYTYGCEGAMCFVPMPEVVKHKV